MVDDALQQVDVVPFHDLQPHVLRILVGMVLCICNLDLGWIDQRAKRLLRLPHRNFAQLQPQTHVAREGSQLMEPRKRQVTSNLLCIASVVLHAHGMLIDKQFYLGGSIHGAKYAADAWSMLEVSGSQFGQSSPVEGFRNVGTILLRMSCRHKLCLQGSNEVIWCPALQTEANV